ncbi:Di-haem oxidoreductase, putative peroxidase [Cohaesibacter sp. ES.047]|uniref:di-heme oxidoredictase family protein n=1 Tax=Cohaesibacter sp. ES.047 TaxID=1798205 RepID=UPI000BB924E9|nr:di-heme oxidoredictase family protein [Cohaesibacter sp. ES.047]SNY91246.1 Di-haem oxidoreductase, putative peroxidase [Cohaesibacter sp. ES.047]
MEARVFGALVGAAVMLLPARPMAAEPVVGDERAVPQHLDLEALAALEREEILRHGRLLFDAKFTSLEGAGRPAATQAEVPVKRRPGRVPSMIRTSGPESNACNGCHNQPNSGGSGEFVVNAFTSEGVSDFEFDTLEAQFSNERGTPHLHGSGLVELIAREMSDDLHALRRKAVDEARAKGEAITVQLITKGVDFGALTVEPDGFVNIEEIDGIDHDLIVRPFSQKGVFTSLRQFSINAMNTHHGMQSNERFGMQWTGTDDFDEDGHAGEITSADLSALVLFQATLPTPGQTMPQAPVLQEAAKDGEGLFDQVACSQCHVKALPLTSLSFTEPGPYNRAGNLRVSDQMGKAFSFELSSKGLEKNEDGDWMVPVFTDFKRHVIADAEKPHFGNERLSQRFIANDQFLTARLWGVGSTAPYGHRGDVTTLREAILHHGGDARDSRLAYEALSDLDQRKIVEFLKSLTLSKEMQP